MHAEKALRIIEHVGELRTLVSITADDVDEYIRTRLRAGRSKGTVHKELVTLRTALSLAVRARRWEGDPKSVVPSFSAEYKPRSDRWLPLDHVILLLRELPDDRAARIAYAVATSAEWSALERAEPNDLNTSTWMVRVRGSKRASRDRIVPLVTPEQRQLAQWAVEHAEGTDGKLFAPWGQSASCLALKRACKRAGIKHISWHDLRRTCAQWLAQRGCTPDLVAAVLGNSPAVAAQVYARLDPVALARRISEVTGCSNSVARELPTGAEVAAVAGDGRENLAGNSQMRVGRQGIEPWTNGLKGCSLLLRGNGKRRAKRGTRKRAVADV